MNKNILIAIGAVVVVLVMVACLFIWRMNIQKTQIALNNRYEAQSNEMQTSLNTMRTTIVNQLKCTREFADKFIAVVAKQAEGRTGGGMFKFNKESESLGLSPDMYMKLANSIEGQTHAFKRSQDTLTDIWQTHKTFCENPWHNILGLNMVQYVHEKPEMIISAETKEAVKTKQMTEELF